jgi:erythromycin esterase-like protein
MGASPVLDAFWHTKSAGGNQNRKHGPSPRAQPETDESLGQQVLTLSSPLVDSGHLDPLLERIGDARYVLLGEASHGTHDYYLWRARISRRLSR